MYEIVLEVEDVRVIGRNANVHVDHFGGLYVFELVAMLLGLYADLLAASYRSINWLDHNTHGWLSHTSAPATRFSKLKKLSNLPAQSELNV